MFSKLRNFSEDVAKSLNQDQARRSNLNELKAEGKVLSTKTPDATELTQPEDEKPDPENDSNQDPVKDEKPNVSLEDLPPSIRSKMKKFAKYEEKYPILLDAYKTEKRKGELIVIFERVLQEHTPVTSIADADILVEFLNGLEEKTKLLNKELRTKTTENSQLSRHNKQFQARIESLETKLKQESKRVSEEEEKVKELEKKVEELETAPEEQPEEPVKADQTEKVEVAEKAEQPEQAEVPEQAENTELKAKNSELEECSKQKLNEEIERYKQSIKELESRGSEVDELKTKLAALEAEKKAWAEEKISLTTSHQAAVSKLESEISQLKPNEPKGNTLKNKKKNKKNKKQSNNVNGEKEVEEKEVESNDVLQAEHDKLVETYRATKNELAAKTEEVEGLRDLLRDLGDDLVQAKDTIKELKKLEGAQKELEAKIEKLEAEKSEAEKLLETRTEKALLVEKELNELHQKHSSLTKEKDSYLKEIETHVEEKKGLNKRIDELTKFKSDDSSLKLELASLKTTISHKDQVIEEQKKKIEELDKQEKELSSSIADLKASNAELSVGNKKLVKEKSGLVNKHELSIERANSLTAELGKLQAEKQKISDELSQLQMRFDSNVKERADSKAEVQMYKQQYEELAMTSKEFSSRIENLEDELTESRNLLQERTRQSGSIRRLLVEAEEQVQAKSEEYKQEIARINEEKVDIERNCQTLIKKKQREIDELRSITDNYLLKIGDLEKNLSDLKVKMESVNTSSTSDTTDLQDVENTISTLRELLQASTKKMKEYENLNTVLKKLNEESNLKFERLSKNYKLLTKQYRQMKETPSEVSSPTRQSMDENEEPTKNSTNIAYLKNVLLGFFEHKDQREQLLPVVKTLFDLNLDDERRFLLALK